MNDTKFEHLMVDIETMGNESFSAITSIAAVEFNMNGETGEEFYKAVKLQSSVDIGLVINPSTVMWWMQQNDEARNELVNIDKEGQDIAYVLSKFRDFNKDKNYQIWGNSARFDLGILQNAYNKLGHEIPWDFRKERCLRTLVSFAPKLKQNYHYEGTAHNALDDCYNQIGYCTLIWNKLYPTQSPLNIKTSEKDRIVEALKQNKGHRQKTSDALGVSERTLYRKMKEYSIKRKVYIPTLNESHQLWKTK